VTFFLIRIHSVIIDLGIDKLIVKSVIPMRIAWFLSKPGIIGFLFFVSFGFILFKEQSLKKNRSKVFFQLVFLICWIFGGGLINLLLVMSNFD
jgi:hypothetical protein